MDAVEDLCRPDKPGGTWLTKLDLGTPIRFPTGGMRDALVGCACALSLGPCMSVACACACAAVERGDKLTVEEQASAGKKANATARVALRSAGMCANP